MKNLAEAVKSEVIKRHNAKTDALHDKIAMLRQAHEDAKEELLQHMMKHPNFEKNSKRRDKTAQKRYSQNDGWEEGRSTPRKNGNW